MANAGSSVSLVVSLGRPIIPDVVGQAQAAAEAAITAASFTVGTVTTAHSDTVAAGNVISQSPTSGTAAASGTAVYIVVSLGQPIVPDVTGQAQAAAEAAITAASFTVGTVTTAHSDTVAAGLVISQSPTSGTAAASGTAVSIVVSLGMPVIPDVVGQAQAAAEAAITAASFTVGAVTTAHSDTVTAGNVISQSPTSGTAAASGTAVSIVVSLGQPIVPDVTGQAQAVAEAAITAASFTVGAVTTAHSDTVAAGNVISQSPVGGTAATSGTAVNIVVSLGQPIVPDVTGQAQAAAEAAITAASFTVGTVTTAHSDTVTAGNVISQSPPSGTAAASGTAVSIVVSLDQPIVPDVTGQAQAAAEAAITAASFTVGTVTTAHSDTVAAGNVISQSPTSGTAAASGTAVNMVVSLGANPRTISGYVRQPDGITSVSDVVIDANNGGGISGISDANGYYHVTVPYGWSGNVTPVKEGYTFEPNMISYSNVTVDDANNYTARLVTYTISGHILYANATPISDVNVVAENGGGAWTSKYGGGSCLTGPDGRYSITVDYNWSGKVMPAKYAYAFEPGSMIYASVVADQGDQHYTGRLMTFAISGYVRNQCGVPTQGVTVTADSGSTALTDANGFYKVWVSYNWSGTVTCAKMYYGFTPAGLAYTGVLGDYTVQDYQAVDIYDLDCSNSIGYGDVGVFSANWLSTIAGNSCDLNHDGIVNFADFAQFSNAWLSRYGK
jgi:beta-lactam-binding protein with PASTA domain